MKRRTILVIAGGPLAGSLSGCISNSLGSESSTPTDDPTTTPSPTSTKSPENTRQRTVTLESQDGVSETHQVSIDAELLEPAITTTETARLRVTMTNEGQTRAFRSKGGDCKRLFTGVMAGSDDPAGLWLYQPDEAEDHDRKEDQWISDRPQSQIRSFPASACSPQEYGSEESVSTEYEVWHDYQVDGYLQPDTYHWGQEVDSWEDTEARATDSPTATFTWGFSISIKK